MALTLPAQHGGTVLAETGRRWLHTLGWVWKRAKLIAQDNDPRRLERLACIHWVWEHLHAWEVLVYAAELDIPLPPKVGAAWMPQGTQTTVMTQGRMPSTILLAPLIWPWRRCGTVSETGKPTRCADLRGVVEERDTAAQYRRLYGGSR